MDIEGIRLWHKVFKPNNELFEIRILGDKPYSGYFYDVEEAIKLIQPYSNNNQIYFTVNEVKSACSSRNQFNCFKFAKGSSTSKNDIEKRQWLPIDIDVTRPSDVSSTDEEKEYAHLKAASVYKFLNENGFLSPVVCDSSSGYHIYYPIDLDNNKENEELVKSFYVVLSSIFTDDKVKIDTVVGDANRIMRLYGTWGRKGRDTEERPHRLSRIIKVPEITDRMSVDAILSFINKYKVEEDKPKYKNNRYNGNDSQFDLRAFIQEHNIQIADEAPYGDGGTKFVLQECPFDSGHKAPDSALFLLKNGAISFRCLHDSCSSYDWSDFRLHFDPNAYDVKQQWQQNMPLPNPYYQKPPKKEIKIKEETTELGKKWFRMKDIKKVNLTEIISLKTGFNILDRAMVGLNLGEVSILSGSNSSGKSSWLNTLILNVINKGNKAALWSGELRPDILKTWIQMVAAGNRNLFERNVGSGKYDVKPECAARIDEWMDDKFFLYNNQYGSKFAQLFNDMKEMVDYGVKLLILDNLFSLDIDLFDGDKNNKQKELILKICEFAKSNQIHLILVCHPRKQVEFLRKDSISGSADLSNAVDNVFIIHRVNNDFVKRGSDFLGKTTVEQYVGYGNVVEVAKNRMYGVVDFLCGMYYDVASRRFKNEINEDIHYGWEDPPKPQSLSFPEPTTWHNQESKDLGDIQKIYDEAGSELPFGASDEPCPF